LYQSLHSVEKSGGSVGFDSHGFRPKDQAVCLVSEDRLIAIGGLPDWNGVRLERHSNHAGVGPGGMFLNQVQLKPRRQTVFQAFNGYITLLHA